jgi:glucan phosphoethanolaminetransferase (alkaline phosphatase superfamily)
VSFFSLIFSLFILKQCDKYTITTKKYLFYFIIFALFIMPVVVAYQIYIKHKEVPGRNPKFYTPSIKNMINITDYFLAITLPKSLINKTKIIKYPPLQKANNPKINIVFVIGESFRAKNAYLLGYKINNMPLLSKQPIIAKKCISIGTMTKVSLGYMLNGASSLSEVSKIYSHDFSLFKLAKENNFKTTFITAQPSVSFKYIKNLIDTNHIDNFQTPLKFTHSEFAALDDKKLIDFLKQFLKQKSFIVFQMNGSHFPYSTKSPKNFKKFKNEYDNSILYTDYVLNKMINFIKEIKTPTYFFFVSDHGELLGEYGKRGHGRLKKEVYEVPFIYFSNTKNQTIENFLKKQKILYQGDIITMLEYLMGYKVKLIPNNKRKVQTIGRDISGYVGYKIITINGNSISESNVLYK